MEITLYIATTADGFIATVDGNSDWVSNVDAASFEAAAKQHGAIILGRKTFEQFQGEIYPIHGVVNFVLTSDSSRESSNASVKFVGGEPHDIIKSMEDEGVARALLVGGSHANGAFFRAGLIDKVIISVHPLFLGSGMSVFAESQLMQKLRFNTSEKMDDGLIKLYYTVCKD